MKHFEAAAMFDALASPHHFSPVLVDALQLLNSEIGRALFWVGGGVWITPLFPVVKQLAQREENGSLTVHSSFRSNLQSCEPDCK